MPKKNENLIDIPIPVDLLAAQNWFASIITRPISDDSCMDLVSPAGCPMEHEAAIYIAPSPTMQPHQRIELYNQQYWWRLITTMHETFPLVTRLFGYHGFNQEISVPYLMKYPPKHWSLITLGKDLTKWVDENYHANDKKLIYDAASLDWAFNDSFIAQQLKPLNLSNLPSSRDEENLLIITMRLQPHIYLFEWNYDLFSFRNAFLDHDPDYWIENDFPELPKGRPYFFVLYRNSQNNIRWKEITAAEHTLLTIFEKGATIEQACTLLENQKNSSIYDEATEHLQQWFQDWTTQGWLVAKNHA